MVTIIIAYIRRVLGGEAMWVLVLISLGIGDSEEGF